MHLITSRATQDTSGEGEVFSASMAMFHGLLGGRAATKEEAPHSSHAKAHSDSTSPTSHTHYHAFGFPVRALRWVWLIAAIVSRATGPVVCHAHAWSMLRCCHCHCHCLPTAGTLLLLLPLLSSPVRASQAHSTHPPASYAKGKHVASIASWSCPGGCCRFFYCPAATPSTTDCHLNHCVFLLPSLLSNLLHSVRLCRLLCCSYLSWLSSELRTSLAQSAEISRAFRGLVNSSHQRLAFGVSPPGPCTFVPNATTGPDLLISKRTTRKTARETFHTHADEFFFSLTTSLSGIHIWAEATVATNT